MLLLAVLLTTAQGCQSRFSEINTPMPVADAGLYSPPLIIAHRGARSLAPENTLAAAQKALELGADAWELDVAMSADGELIVIHDDTLDRTSNAADIFPQRKPWRVHEFTLEEIRQLDFGSWFAVEDPFDQIAAGQVSDEELESFTGEPLATLRQALDFTRQNQWQVNVELKDLVGKPGDELVVPQVVALIQELKMHENVLLSSFNQDYLKQIKEIDPSVRTGILVRSGYPNPVALVQRLSAQAYHPQYGEITPQEILALRQNGIEVNIWTVNDPQDMQRLIEAGASGIITDFPQVLARLLEKLPSESR